MGYVSSVSSSVSSYEPVTTSGEISFSGLGNGTDFSEIIDATIDAESFQLEAYEAQQEENEYIIDILEELEEAIDDFNETLDDIDEPDEFYSLLGECSSDEVEVDVDGEAEEGTHTIVVNQLALNDVWVSNDQGYDSEDTVIASEATTLEVEFQGETISIDVAAGTTLNGLVTTINGSVDARDKFEADLMYDGSSYYFVLNSTDAGADNVITVTDTGSLTGMSVDGFVNTQTGQNAQIKVDGFPVDEDAWIERDTNSIDDVVDGITFELKETTDSDGVIVTVEYDTDEMFDTITEFVEGLNQIILDLQLITGRVTEEEDSDEETYTLNSYALDIMYSEIKSIISSGALGFQYYDEDEGGDYYSSLSQIGFYTDTDEDSDTYGQLLLDEDELEEALDTDPEAVAQLFAARAEGESDSSDFQVISVIDTVTPAGDHTVEYTVEGGEITSATIDGEEASVDGWTILGTGSSAKGLYLSIANQADGDYSGTARVKQGKIGELSDALDNYTNEESGTLAILIENYEDSVDSLDNQIYNEEKRLDSLETSLQRKYSALDSLLSTYETQADTLSSLLSSSS
ncbi:flagellar filament capping protein FliD [Pseudodesulfovibrio cashew]|uniref:Flagellar hook-associated protein 2 n=1 Tax=Pseudodesulfovibrio cashew TaxID=2678688 RepID=A0A6I6JGQ6_9BACT|nr:flagellar filament capping protein FliD [Pseudodesulfovibrio cashew]QGY39552.1 flagellar filament capping protein FliD [Pseudodesulfovibrio cashew]